MTVNDLGKIDVHRSVYFLVKYAERDIIQIEKAAAGYRTSED